MSYIDPKRAFINPINLESPQYSTSAEQYLLKRINELEEENRMLKKSEFNRISNNVSYEEVLNAANKEIADKDSIILKLNKECDNYRNIIKTKQEFFNSITPSQVYHHKERGNTTVKFLDGTSVTVKKMAGDKDCLETAIVYAIFKKTYPKPLMKALIKHKIETGGK